MCNVFPFVGVQILANVKPFPSAAFSSNVHLFSLLEFAHSKRRRGKNLGVLSGVLSQTLGTKMSAIVNEAQTP